MPVIDKPQYVVNLDIYVARRTRLHQVTDAEGVSVFHAALLIDVLSWLAERDAHLVRFTDEEVSHDLTFLHPTEPPPT